MATGTSPLTELDAVNMILEAAFEAPVNTLDVAGIEDVAIARRNLSSTIRAALLRGVANNVERNVTLMRDTTTNKIPLPLNTLRVDAERGETADIVQRGRYLYDRENHTFTFTGNVVVEIYYHLEWDDLPEHIKYAATVLAARRYQKHALGDADKGGFDKTDELEARVILEEADADAEDSNVMTDSYSVSQILQR